MSERSMHFTSRGYRSQVFALAPDINDPKSKRYDIIDKEVLTHCYYYCFLQPFLIEYYRYVYLCM